MSYVDIPAHSRYTRREEVDRMEKLLTPEAVEARFGLTRRVQERLRRKRMLSYVKVTPGRGGRILYEEASVIAFLDSRRVEAC